VWEISCRRNEKVVWGHGLQHWCPLNVEGAKGVQEAVLD